MQPSNRLLLGYRGLHCQSTHGPWRWVVKLAPENLSLESFLQKSITIFPNPVNNRINLDRIVKSIKITDISGKVIGIYRDTDGVEVSDLIHGIYFLTFELENGVTETKKIIKI